MNKKHFCKNCKKEFFPKHPNWFESRFRKFCSKSCANSFNVRGKLGSDSNRWEGGFDPKRYLKEWRKENPNRLKAHVAVREAIRAGKLIPQPCKVCGDNLVLVHAHHVDYKDPLNVTWLCSSCHKREHVRLVKVI